MDSDLTPEQIADIVAAIPGNIREEKLIDVIAELQRQLEESEKANHNWMIDYGIKCAERATARRDALLEARMRFKDRVGHFSGQWIAEELRQMAEELQPWKGR